IDVIGLARNSDRLDDARAPDVDWLAALREDVLPQPEREDAAHGDQLAPPQRRPDDLPPGDMLDKDRSDLVADINRLFRVVWSPPEQLDRSHLSRFPARLSSGQPEGRLSLDG